MTSQHRFRLRAAPYDIMVGCWTGMATDLTTHKATYQGRSPSLVAIYWKKRRTRCSITEQDRTATTWTPGCEEQPPHLKSGHSPNDRRDH